jgi:mannosyltransferase OCH1-like enzyme
MERIPKLIHYCWYGKGEKPTVVKQCIESWRKTNPEMEIVEWNESNSPQHDIVQQNIKHKLYAFASDYTRLYALYQHGGIYLDTDVYLKKSLNALLKYNAFLAFESSTHITNGVSGAHKNHPFFKQCLDRLEKRGHSKKDPYLSALLTMDVLHTYKKDIEFKEQEIKDIKILLPKSFYPITFEASKTLDFNTMLNMEHPDSFGVHLFMHSWKGAFQEGFIKKKMRSAFQTVKQILTN